MTGLCTGGGISIVVCTMRGSLSDCGFGLLRYGRAFVSRLGGKTVKTHAVSRKKISRGDNVGFSRCVTVLSKGASLLSGTGVRGGIVTLRDRQGSFFGTGDRAGDGLGCCMRAVRHGGRRVSLVGTSCRTFLGHTRGSRGNGVVGRVRLSKLGGVDGRDVTSCL